MARIQKIICASCTGTIRVGESYCDHCGQPTTWASYEERIDWEVRQWRNARSRSGTSEVIQPRYAQSRGSGVAVAQMDAPPQQAVATSVDVYGDASPPDVPRESLFARLRGFMSRLLDLFNAPTETSSDDETTAAADGGNDALEPVARPTLVIVNDIPTEAPEPVAPQAVVDVPAEPAVVPEPVVAAPPVEPTPVVVGPVVEAAALPPAAPEADAPEADAPEVVAPEAESVPVATVTPGEPAASAAATTSAASSPARRVPAVRKRPTRPTNKELLQRALKTLERVDDRLRHLEEEIEEIDQAVRKSPAASSAEDDDLEPPAAPGPFGYI